MIDKRTFKGTDILRIELESIQMELSSFNDYINETATTLKHKQKDTEKQYKLAKQKNPENDELVDAYFDRFHRYHELFPTYTYNSLLVAQFSFLEVRLKFLCELYQRKKFTKIKVDDLYGSDIEKCKRYLTLVAEINFDSFKEKWEKITKIQRLRNAIVHRASRIDKVDKNTEIFIKSDGRIEYVKEEYKFYIKDASFLIEFSKLLFDFFTLLVEKLLRKRVLARNTTMPYNNPEWGQEKVENSLKEIINILELIKDNETRTDKFKNSDLKFNIRSSLSSMSCNLTKLFAFFHDGKWEPNDKDIIIEKGKAGLKHLKKAYTDSI